MNDAATSRSLNPWLALSVTIGGCAILGALSGLLSNSGPGPWYDTLVKSPLTPPSWVFGIVWPILYVLMGVSAWLIWQLPRDPARSHALRLFVAQFLVNLAWSPVFFGAHLITLSVVLIAMLLTLVALTLWRFCALNRLAAALLLPYLGWITFALYLNAFIWVKNAV